MVYFEHRKYVQMREFDPVKAEEYRLECFPVLAGEVILPQEQSNEALQENHLVEEPIIEEKEVMNLEEKKAFLKDKGVKATHLMGEDKVNEKIKEFGL